MRAVSDADLFDFEGNLQAAFKSYLDELGFSIATSNDPERLGNDFVAVEISILGLQDEHMVQRPYGGNVEYDHYSYSVQITIHTDRTEDETPSAEFAKVHQQTVAKIRAALSILRAYDKKGGLNKHVNFYTINRLMPAATEYEADGMGYDSTILNYNGDFAINQSAFPINN